MMKKRSVSSKSIFLALLVGVSGGLLAQTEERRTESATSSFSVRELVNNQNAMSVLSGGTGGFYVSTPGPGYRVDVELAYFNPEYRPAEIQLLSGERFELPARYRVVDQTFEVQHEGQTYDLDPGLLHRVRQDGALFIQQIDLLFPKDGRTVYQRHYQDPSYQLLEQHQAIWQDPPPPNLFDTREQFRTLRRASRLLLIVADRIFEIKKSRDVLRALDLDKNGPEAKFIRQQGLDVRQAADVERLLRHMAEQG